jgi:CelD/BcsL family acetyltransferase involved in cellulose biosynthesis
VDLTTRVLEPHELTDQHIKRWLELEERSIEQNAYLSPYFILPALKYLPPRGKPMIVFIETGTGNTGDLLGVGVFERSPRTIQVPVCHLKAYRCLHAYLTGLLTDQQYFKETTDAFFSFFHDSRRDWCGVEFVNRRKESDLASRFDIAASQLDMCWFEYSNQRRPILLAERAGDTNMKNVLAGKRRKILRQNLRRLNDLGKVKWRVAVGQEIDQACINTFLELEHMGWKKGKRTSLLSHANDEAFFREMMNRFAQAGRAFFTELSINGKVIASTSNLISGQAGFAFKIGWDEVFSKLGPGILNEVEFMKYFPELLPNLKYVDSGAGNGSFIEKLWPDHVSLVSGFYVSNPTMKPLIQAMNFLRKVKHRFLN